MNKLGRRIGRASGAIAMALCALCASRANAQPTNTIVVCDDSANPADKKYCAIFTDTGYTVVNTLKKGLDQVRDPVSGFDTLLLVEKTTTSWQAPLADLEFKAGDNFTIIGYPKKTPYAVVIEPENSTDPVVTYSGGSVKLEGVTLTGGSTGIEVDSGTATVSRCYIRDNTGDGVLVKTGGILNLTNCSIADNGGVESDCGSTVSGESKVIDENFDSEPPGPLAGWPNPLVVIPADVGLPGTFAIVTTGLVNGTPDYEGTDAATTPNIAWQNGVLELDMKMPLNSADAFNIVLALQDDKNYLRIGLYPQGSSNPDIISLVQNGSEIAQATTPASLVSDTVHHLKVVKREQCISLYVDGNSYLTLVNPGFPQASAFYFRGAGRIVLDNVVLKVFEAGEGAGVHVMDGATATILHCSIIENGGDGIFAEANAPVTVTNTFAYNNGGNDIACAVPALDSTNKVTASYNGLSDADYFQVTDLGGSIKAMDATAAQLLNNPWIGKVTYSAIPPRSKLIDAGTSTAGVKDDFEREPRSDPIPDIGADEVYDGTLGGWNTWDGCYVWSDRGGVIRWNLCGAVAVGELNILVWYDGVLTAGELFVVPQGGVPGNPIPIRLDSNSIYGSNSGVYHGTNTKAITTLLPPDIVDGHAQVYIYIGGGIIPVLPIGQAITGRDFLIDTIPPRVLSVTLSPYVPDYAVNTLLSLASACGPQAANGVAWPCDPIPTVKYPWITPGLCGATFDTTTEGPKAFYNVGSLSNNYAGFDFLDVVAKVVFEDPDVSMVLGPSAPANRQVSGFGGGASGSDTVDNILITGTGLPVRWAAMQLEGSLTGVDAKLAAISASNRLNASDDGVFGLQYQNKTGLEASWSFLDTVSSNAGIPMTSCTSNYMHLAGIPTSIDLAGNRTDIMKPDWQPLPLHIWWLRGFKNDVQATVTLRPANAEGKLQIPRIEWKVNPPYDLGVLTASGPKPIYAYRIWKHQNTGRANEQGPYDPATPWNWVPYNGLSPYEFCKAIDNNYDYPNIPQSNIFVDAMRNRWYVVTVIAADPAGNVDQWPAELTAGMTVNFPADHNPATPNWYRFFVPSEAGEVDTTISASFQHVNATGVVKNFGSATIVPYAHNADELHPLTVLLANFNIGLIAPNQGDLPLALVHVELIEDGTLIFDGQLASRRPPPLPNPLPDPMRVLWLPFDKTPHTDPYLSIPPALPVGAYDPYDFDLGDGTRTTINTTRGHLGRPDRVVEYVLRASTVLYYDVAHTDKKDEDTSPASFKFKVVPGSVDQYLEQYLEETGRDQPVKIFERE